MPDQNDRSADVTDPAAPGASGTGSAPGEIPSTERNPEPMLDVHPPHHAANSLRDFFVHIATIVIGLLIAVGLEQTVEWAHHRHQRHQLQEDLHDEAEKNLQVIDRDLKMQDLEPWFEEATRKGAPTEVPKSKLQIQLPAPPCLAGSVGTAEVRYFAPSQAVWTTAKEGSLVELLPVEQARMQTRLAHNYDLLAVVRDHVYDGCQSIVAMRTRFAQPDPSQSGGDLWTMTPEQAERLASTAADTNVAIQGLLFRLRWSKVYEEGILNNQPQADVKMMTINQERFEDQAR